MTKTELVEYLFSSEFKNKLNNYFNDIWQNVLEDNPEDYGAQWDSNPYCVEPQLAGGSGCWAFPSWGEEQAYDDAMDKILLEIDEDDCKIINEIDIDENDIEWIKAIVKYLLKDM